MRFRQYSFSKKIFLSCLALNLVLLLISSVIFYKYTAKSLKQQMQDTLSGNTSILMDSLDSMIIDADNALKLIQTSSSFLNAVKDIKDSETNYFSSHVPVSSACKSEFIVTLHSTGLNGTVSYLSSYNDNLSVSLSGESYSYIDKDTLRSIKELSNYLDSSFYVAYSAPHISYWDQKTETFSVVRSMRDMYKQYGILVFDFNSDDIAALLNNFENPDNYSITILDSDKNPVYVSSDSVDIEQVYAAYMGSASAGDTGYDSAADGTTNSREMNTGTFSYDKYSLSHYTVSPLTGWTFILTYSTEPYMRSLGKLVLISALLFISLSVIMSTFLLLLTHQLTRPLTQLVEKLKGVNPGDNIDVVDVSGQDNNEIVLLTNTIHNYLSEIYDKNERLVESRHREMAANYAAMEAQLNPHFLYNTLSVIGATGLTDNNTTVYTMCNELASQLRYSLSYSGQAVPLSREIQHAKSYLYIMHMRYENDLNVTWDIEPAVNDIHVPKLTLQPLIENCFQHGFRRPNYEVPPPWKIRISGRIDEDRWFVSVCDNGAPFDEDKLAAIKDRLSQLQATHSENADTSPAVGPSPTVGRQGYGLENTILRLSIFYDGDVYFEVENSADGWTSITIGGSLT